VEVATSTHGVLEENGKEALSFDLEPAKGMGSTAEKAFLQSLENLKLKKDLPAIVEKLRGATASPRPKVAVFPFKNAGFGADWYELSQTLTGMVITALINAKKFEVVERELLEKIMEEKKLGMSGLTDLGEDIQIAQLAGAQYLVVGSVSGQAGKIEADARLVSVDKGSALKAASGAAGSRMQLRELANLLVEELKKAKAQ
jgi:TolB-like protein